MVKIIDMEAIRHNIKIYTLCIEYILFTNLPLKQMKIHSGIRTVKILALFPFSLFTFHSFIQFFLIPF